MHSKDYRVKWIKYFGSELAAAFVNLNELCAAGLSVLSLLLVSSRLQLASAKAPRSWKNTHPRNNQPRLINATRSAKQQYII